ncbi:MAG: hypothetical protein HQM11_14485 [SAR324 cluster bacterium]|nr:hypothetical protein [SAR324 cluster bacterium]
MKTVSYLPAIRLSLVTFFMVICGIYLLQVFIDISLPDSGNFHNPIVQEMLKKSTHSELRTWATDFPRWLLAVSGHNTVQGYVLFLKWSATLLTLGLTWLLCGIYYGILSSITITVLLGQPWMELWTPSAFLQVFPWILGIWLLQFHNGVPHGLKKYICPLMASIVFMLDPLTGTGLLVSVSFYLLFWGPGVGISRGSYKRLARSLTFYMRLLLLATFAVPVIVYGWRISGKLFSEFFLLPLTIILLVSGEYIWSRRFNPDSPKFFIVRIQSLMLFLLLTLSGIAAGLMLSYGFSASVHYPGNLLKTEFMTQLPLVSHTWWEQPEYRDFMHFSWIGLPVLTSLLIGLIWTLKLLFPNEVLFLRYQWHIYKSQAVSLMMLSLINVLIAMLFVPQKYLSQVSFLYIPLLFYAISQLEAFFMSPLSPWKQRFQGILATILILWLSPLFYSENLKIIWELVWETL